jgi:hypothetical protein
LINILCGPVTENTIADCVENDLRGQSEFLWYSELIKSWVLKFTDANVIKIYSCLDKYKVKYFLTTISSDLYVNSQNISKHLQMVSYSEQRINYGLKADYNSYELLKKTAAPRTHKEPQQ